MPRPGIEPRVSGLPDQCANHYTTAASQLLRLFYPNNLDEGEVHRETLTNPGSKQTQKHETMRTDKIAPRCKLMHNSKLENNIEERALKENIKEKWCMVQCQKNRKEKSRKNGRASTGNRTTDLWIAGPAC